MQNIFERIIFSDYRLSGNKYESQPTQLIRLFIKVNLIISSNTFFTYLHHIQLVPICIDVWDLYISSTLVWWHLVMLNFHHFPHTVQDSLCELWQNYGKFEKIYHKKIIGFHSKESLNSSDPSSEWKESFNITADSEIRWNKIKLKKMPISLTKSLYFSLTFYYRVHGTENELVTILFVKMPYHQTNVYKMVQIVRLVFRCQWIPSQ